MEAALLPRLARAPADPRACVQARSTCCSQLCAPEHGCRYAARRPSHPGELRCHPEAGSARLGTARAEYGKHHPRHPEWARSATSDWRRAPTSATRSVLWHVPCGNYGLSWLGRLANVLPGSAKTEELVATDPTGNV